MAKADETFKKIRSVHELTTQVLAAPAVHTMANSGCTTNAELGTLVKEINKTDMLMRQIHDLLQQTQ